MVGVGGITSRILLELKWSFKRVTPPYEGNWVNALTRERLNKPEKEGITDAL